MDKVRISPKFQVVLLRDIRKALGLKTGLFVRVIQYENRIEYIPDKKIKTMRCKLLL